MHGIIVGGHRFELISLFFIHNNVLYVYLVWTFQAHISKEINGTTNEESNFHLKPVIMLN